MSPGGRTKVPLKGGCGRLLVEGGWKGVVPLGCTIVLGNPPSTGGWRIPRRDKEVDDGPLVALAFFLLILLVLWR